MISAIRRYGVEIVSLFVAVLIWQLTAGYVTRGNFILPSFIEVLASFYYLMFDMMPKEQMTMSFTDIMRSFYNPQGDLIRDVATSLLHFGIGMAGGMCVAIPLGVGMGWFRVIDRIFDPIIEILRPIPPLAWIPFAIVFIGLTHTSAGTIVFVGAVFPILINTHQGFRNVPKVLIEAAMVLGCTRNYDLIRKVAFPSAIPDIATGIRVAMGVAWMCVVAAEMFGVSKAGIGYKIFHWMYLHRMDHVMAYMLLLGFIALFIDRAFRFLIDERLSKWRKGVVA